MIITCASCLTKYHLDDTRISEKGAKVRCSRCKHIFYVVPPPETKEEIAENFESFARYHEELIEKDRKDIEAFPFEKEEKETKPGQAETEEEVEVTVEEEEEKHLFSDQPSQTRVESVPFPKYEGEMADVEEARPKKVAREEGRMRGRGSRRPSRLLALVVVIALLVIGLFYIWAEMESGGKLSSYIESPRQTVTQLWERILGTEREGLVVKDLTGYEEKVGEFPLFVIEGKLDNQSRKTKKHIKVRVTIFDQNRGKVAEKETICGRTISRGDLGSLPFDFFYGEMLLQPKTEMEMVARPGQTIPFMILFRDLPVQAKEFKVEIVEAPNL